jgi:hypothetical protein
MKKTKKKQSDRRDKFCYSVGDLKIIKQTKLKEHYTSFAEFLFEKEEVPFNDKTMRWITIKDENDRNQHVLIKKKDGTVLAGMGGEHNGERLKDVFKDIEDDKNDSNTLVKDFYRQKISTEDEIHGRYAITPNDVTPDEDYTIAEYCAEKYRNINKFLREDYDDWKMWAEMMIKLNYSDDQDDSNYKTPEEIKEKVKSILPQYKKEAIESSKILSSILKANATQENMITYRGVDKLYIDSIKDNLKVGSMFEDAGFVSSSTDREVAQSFAGYTGYTMEILIPKGSRATSVKHFSTLHAEENEVLIDKNAKFTVCELDHKNQSMIVMLSH